MGRISEITGVSPIVIDVLAQRGIRDIDKIVKFLRPSLLDVPSPFLFRDMRVAVERLASAHTQKEKVLIYGDYDVDGVTSTTLLYKVLIDLGFQAVAYIPHRQEEGYGLHQEVIEKAHKAGVKVIVTVDCGITASAEVDRARELEIDIIVTDHHEPPENLPQALAIINPKADEGYPFKELAGVGVAFKLAQALLHTFGNNEAGIQSEIELLDLVALGTIADVVPLIEENRIYVFYGLKQMQDTGHVGLRALLEECGLADKTVKASQIAFMVAPRINAAGRMDSARMGLELLLCGDMEKARDLARALTKENLSRQETEKEILAGAIEQIEKSELPRVIVLSSPGWHHGVIGIVASRLVERYYRPVFLISEEDSGAKGSARGIPGYHILEQLRTQAHLLNKFGGHKQAAGFSLPAENISLMRAGLNKLANELPDNLFSETLTVDKFLELNLINQELLTELEYLAPYGFGNSGPVFAGRSMPVGNIFAVGKDGSHLKVVFNSDRTLEGMAFRQGERLRELSGNKQLDVVFTLDWNTYQGRKEVQLLIKDLQPSANWKSDNTKEELTSSQAGLAMIEDKAIVKAVNEILGGLEECANSSEDEYSDLAKELLEIQGHRINKLTLAETVKNVGLEEICGYISREELIKTYQLLREQAKKSNTFYWTPSGKKDCRSLKIFEELGIIRCLGGTERVALEWQRLDRKLDLDCSLTFRTSRILFEKVRELSHTMSGLFDEHRRLSRVSKERQEIANGL
ncbi:MAG: single-stranded-DNA-specific exonuclease RecJ [Desulfitobacterium hafniense]|nr:single-stranded-DNA-specific exonuclease RecJ [Desulfitobacterium hafniense]